MLEGFSLFIHPQWDGAVEIRGLTATSTHAAWRGRPHALYALEWEGRGDRGVDGNVDACGLGGRGDRMRRTRSGGRVVIRFG